MNCLQTLGIIVIGSVALVVPLCWGVDRYLRSRDVKRRRAQFKLISDNVSGLEKTYFDKKPRK